MGRRLHLQPLEHQRGHGVHARIARADQRHPVAAGRQRERPIHALRLLAQRMGMANLIAARRQQVEVAPVADQMGGGSDGPIRGGGSPGRRARPEPHHRQHPARTSEPQGVDG